MDKKIFEIINRISIEHCKKPFGYLKKEDIKNEIWIICLEIIKEYEKDKGELEHFLRVGVRNRLINRFKDITKSVRSPCPRCPFFRESGKPDNCKKFHHNREMCDKWNNYQLSIKSRNSLLNASEQTFERKDNNNFVDIIIDDELRTYITNRIDHKYINDFNEFINGGKISKKKIKKLKKMVEDILKDK